MNMGASFNRSSWRLKGDVIGTEFRAFNNLGWARGVDQLGVTAFGPNLNIARDPVTTSIVMQATPCCLCVC
jgi:beta-D-xylosidase 4